MKKILLHIILIVNAVLWTVLSAINYVRIMQQLNEDVNRIFLWSIFTAMMYGLLWYSFTLIISRIFYIYQYRNNKIKYMNTMIFCKQLIYHTMAVIYLYGICYFDAKVLGLIPIFLFFGKKFIQCGRFYVYEEGQMILFDETGRQYIIRDVNISEGKISAEEENKMKNYIIDDRMNPGEKAFLLGFSLKEIDEKEVA